MLKRAHFFLLLTTTVYIRGSYRGLAGRSSAVDACVGKMVVADRAAASVFDVVYCSSGCIPFDVGIQGAKGASLAI